MPKVIAVINQKGGVGKTTTVVNLAAGLSLLSKKILIIDLDPQGNATSGLGINKESLDLTTYDLLIGREKINNIIKQIKIADNKKIYICPATAELAGADIELHDDENRENILKNNIDFEVIKDFDFVIIDCPPSLSLLSINTLSASNAILVPIQCEFYAMEGLVQLNKTIGLVKYTPAVELPVGAVSATKSGVLLDVGLFNLFCIVYALTLCKSISGDSLVFVVVISTFTYKDFNPFISFVSFI